MPLKVHQDELPTINLTSMIDVVFLLIIFFMVGTRFSESENALKLDLPKVVDRTTSNTNQNNSKSIQIYRDGTIELDRQFVSLNDLTRILVDYRRQNPQVSITVRSDASITMQRGLEVAAAIKQAGIERVAFTTSQSTMAR